MIKLVILDFDGTLADTVELIVLTNQETQRRMNYPVCEPEKIIATIGLPLEECIVTMYPEVKQEEMPQWLATYREVFDGLKQQMVPSLFPQVLETLRELHRRGIVLTVASSRGKVSLADFLQEMCLAPYISYVLAAEDVTHAKPNPEPVLKTLEALSFKPEETLVVGDMPVDIQMGLGAGTLTCGVTYGNSNRAALTDAGANFVIDNFGELSSIV
jgi:phosphoglycolate phosphatase